MPISLAEAKLQQCLAKTEISNKSKINITELSILKNTAINGLAGVIGTASAYRAFNLVNVVRAKGQGFVPYKWPKPGVDDPVNKISFVKGFTPWQ